MRKEYTYSMPESFMKDQSVPARWRLLGIVNGFHINGKTFYASNDWLMNELDCSQQTVSNAVAELENLGEIRCERTKTSRIIHRKTTNQLVPPYKSTGIPDPNQLVPISDSISDSKSSAFEDEQRVKEVPDLEEISKSRAKYTNARKAFGWFRDYEKWWDMNTTQLKYGELIFLRGEKAVRSILLFLYNNRELIDCPEVTTPYDLETKWKKIEKFAKRNGL